MEKIKIKLILVIFLAILIIIPFIFAQVGIVKLAGTPEIVSCVPDKEVFSGDTYNSQVIVKNIGESAGEFSVSVECMGDVSGYGSSEFVESNSQISLSVNLAGTNTEKYIPLTSVCTYTITDLNSQAKDSCNNIITIKYDSPGICNSESTYCDGSKLIVCDSEGRSPSIQKECQEECVWKRGEAKCKEEIEINTKDNSIPSALIISLGIILGLVLLGLLIRRRNK